MKYYIADVFAEEKYQGNQLAVFIPDHEVTGKEMQQIAREVNFSEITFIVTGKQDNGGYGVKIFTPDTEVPFAGHPTLGTAYIIHKIIEKGKSDKVLLNLQVGAIPVTIGDDGLTMKQNEPSFGMIIENVETIAGILNINAEDIRADYPIRLVSTGLPFFIVPLKTLDAVKRCAINHHKYQHFLDNIYKCGILVFTPDTEFDLRARVFMDDTGFLEDPATGSANGDLAGYLLKYNFFNNNKIKYTVGQGQEIKRPSLIRVEADKTGEAYNILVGGNVHIVAEGEWY